MTERIPGLMGFVVRELKTNPGIGSGELYEKSLGRYPDVRGMSLRQFHARYPLQAKRQLNKPIVRRFPVPKPPEPAAAEAGGADPTARTGEAAGGSPTAAATANESAPASASRPAPARTSAAASPQTPEEPRMPLREEVRLLLFRLAMDLETAHTRADVVDVIARLDRYVDEAMAIGAGRSR